METQSGTVAEMEAGMRALVQALAPSGSGGSLAPGAARLVAALQGHLGLDLDVAALEPIAPDPLAARLTDPWLRQQLVRAIIVGLLIDGAPTAGGLARARAIAAALQVIEPGLDDVERFLAGQRLRLRFHLLRRFWAIDRIKARIAERGFFRTVVPAIYATVFGRYRNKALAARYATLRDLPAGTLGRGFIDYLEQNHFPLPGERGAVSDIIVQHDLAHVLGGYGTTPGEEVLVATFSAGHRRRDPFAFVLFVLFQFHLGVQMTPGAAPEVGHFDPARVLAAIARGAAMRTDLTSAWDFWAEMAEPIAALRLRHGIAPRDLAASLTDAATTRAAA